MPTNAHKRHVVGTGGPWGTGLLVLGLLCAVHGAGQAASNANLPPALEQLAGLAPMWVWGGLWILAGLYAVLKALTPPQKHSDVWPVVGISLMWASNYFLHWLIVGVGDGEWGREWAGASIYGCLAALVISWGRCVNPPHNP